MAWGKIGEGAVSNEPSERGNSGRKKRVVFVRDIFEKPETGKNKYAGADIIFVLISNCDSRLARLFVSFPGCFNVVGERGGGEFVRDTVLAD